MTGPMLCVRCGYRSVAPPPFICDACRASPETRTEIRRAESLNATHAMARRYLMSEYGWVGGWPPLRELVR